MDQRFDEVFDPTLAEKLPLPDWQKAELERREAEYQCDPSLASTWDEAKQRILAKHGR